MIFYWLNCEVIITLCARQTDMGNRYRYGKIKILKPDEEKTKAALIEELKQLRSRADHLQEKVVELQQTLDSRQRGADSQQPAVRPACSHLVGATEALRLQQVIIDNSPAFLFRRTAGDDPRLVYVSPNISRLGYDADDFLSGKIKFGDIVHPDDSERIIDEIRAFTDQDVEEYTQTYRIVTRNGDVRWVEDKTSVVWDSEGRKTHHQGILMDISDLKQTEEKLRKSEEKFRRIVETTGEGFLMMDENLKVLDVNDAYCSMLGFRREDLLGRSPMEWATPEFKNFMITNRERMLAKEHRRFEGSLVAKDGRVVPVLVTGNTLTDTSGLKLGNVAFVTDLTEQKRTLELAGQVQKSLIPGTAPRIAGFDIAGRSDPCDEVGGDYFDFLFGPEFSSESLKVVVGDISGHGVDAALLMTTARALIRSRATHPGTASQIVSAMNRDLVIDMQETGHFMTLFLMDIDPRRGSARWVRAGHEPALIYHPDSGKFDSLVGVGLPLGIDENFAYTEYPMSRLPPGTIIVMGTDGIWEATDSAGACYGKSQFKGIIQDLARQSSAEIVNGVFTEVHNYTRGLPPKDDITLVVIKIEPDR